MASTLGSKWRVFCCILAFLTMLLMGCLLDLGGENVNAPRGDSIEIERFEEFSKVISHLKTLKPGIYYSADLPPEFRIKNLHAAHVDERKAYALEFPSHPVDSNPIYIYVEEGVPNPEDVAKDMCKNWASWRYSGPLREKNWYYVYGP